MMTMTQPATSRSGSRIVIPSQGRYQIDPARSSVAFTTRHLFGLGPVRGTLALRDGEIHVADPVTGSAARARIGSASFHTGNPARDATVLSPRLLDAEAHPYLRFSSTGLEQADGRWVLRGELEVRGTCCPLDVRIEQASSTGGTLRVAASATVDRYAFDVTGFRGLAARRLQVRLDVIAERI
jgi:polyisoprenoid-binding protein YceI